MQAAASSYFADMRCPQSHPLVTGRLQGAVSKLAGAISGKIAGSGHNSRQNSRQNSRTGRRKSGGTELEHFEDARTGLTNPSDSSDGSYQNHEAYAEPMAAHQ